MNPENFARRVLKVAAPAIALGLMLAAPAALAQTIADKAAVCAACHGEKGVPQDKLIPIIWGQSQGYLYLQLRDFKKAARVNEIMQAIVADLEKDDFVALAEYFSSKPWPALQQPRAADATARIALTANSSVGCTGCHLDQFQGDGGSVPRLAGQSHDYIIKTIAEFRNGVRGNNPGMTSLMKATAETDLAALSEYLAGL